MINVGLIGFGYWGPNIARNISEIEGMELKVICDLDPGRLSLARRKFLNSSFLPDAKSIFDDPEIDAVFIATPINTHYSLVKRALESSKHVFVEKPITNSSEQAQELCSIAEKNNLVLMVDHTFLYTGAVEKIRELIVENYLGEINYIDSVRINLGIFQKDSNVIWDLAPHDLSIFSYILGKGPSHVSAVGAAHLSMNENISYLTLLFEGGTIGHIHVNWMSPVKVRKMIIGGTKKMIIYDDVEPSEKIRIYNTSAEINENPYEVLVQYRTGDVLIPRIDNTEALKKEITDFKKSIETRRGNRNSGSVSVEIVKIIEAAEKSLKNNGVLVAIK